MINNKFDFYQEKDPSKINVLFIHGFGATYSFANSLKHQKSRWFNMIGLNLPPSGKSQMDNTFSLENYAYFVEEFINEQKLDNLYVVGHSMGGAICAFLASNPKVKKAILVSPLHPYATFSHNPAKYAWSMPEKEKDSLIGTEKLVFNQDIWKKSGSLELNSKNYLGFISKNRKELENIFFGQISFFKYLQSTLLAKYKENKEKFFVISGNQDNYIEKEFLEKTIKKLNLKHKFIDNCGHCPIFENSSNFLQILKKIVI